MCVNVLTVSVSRVDRCSALVDLAYRHNVLLLTEDIYNLIYFTHAPSPRLLSYDKQVRSERKQDKGHVVSVGTFSKFMAPSLRFGWIEAPENVLSALNNRLVLLKVSLHNTVNVR